MKNRILITILSLMVFATPMWAQKLSKEEKAAKAKAEYAAAVSSVEAKQFAIVPDSYTSEDGTIEANTDNSNFFSCEGENVFMQGEIVCGSGNTYTNIAEPTEFECTFNKKGNMRLEIVVSGRRIKGTYVISMRANSNMADVIFSRPQGGQIKFSGAILPLKAASFNKRSNPI